MKPVLSITVFRSAITDLNNLSHSKYLVVLFCYTILARTVLAGSDVPTSQLSPASHDTLTTLVTLVGANTTASSHTSRIEGDSFSGVSGIVEVNVTGGDLSIQQNSAAIVESSAYGLAFVEAYQKRQVDELSRSTTNGMRSDAAIKDNAFDHALGLIMVNQSSGGENTQVNGAAIALGGLVAIGGVQLNDNTLDQSYGIATPISAGVGDGGSVNNVDTTTIDPSSFTGARGIFLINQVSGRNNYSGNSFTLTTSPK